MAFRDSSLVVGDEVGCEHQPRRLPADFDAESRRSGGLCAAGHESRRDSRGWFLTEQSRGVRPRTSNVFFGARRPPDKRRTRSPLLHLYMRRLGASVGEACPTPRG
jgi:hypothetical protein